MRTRLLALGAATVLAAAALTGCVPVGPALSDSPEIGDVTGVVLNTGGSLTISEGEPSLTIHAPQRLLAVLTTREDDGVLHLGRRAGPFTFAAGEIRYELTVPTLESIVVNGAGDIVSTVSGGDLTIEIRGTGDIDVAGIDAGAVEVRIDGSGDVELAGTADSLEIAIDGTGHVNADGLEVTDAVVQISGAGDARLHVTGTLRAELSGVGSVRHRGGARVESEISGLGDVTLED